MKRTLFIVILSVISSHLIKAQIAGVEKSVFNAQTGILGVWINQEQRLSNETVLRSEIGLDGQLWGGTIYSGTRFALQPIFTLEPRWYTNLEKRAIKGKPTANNSGNFIGLKISYRPDLFVISNASNTLVIPDLFIAPTWGLRRRLGQHLNFEWGFALGGMYTYYRRIGFTDNEFELAIQMNLRIGLNLN